MAPSTPVCSHVGYGVSGGGPSFGDGVSLDGACDGSCSQVGRSEGSFGESVGSPVGVLVGGAVGGLVGAPVGEGVSGAEVGLFVVVGGGAFGAGVNSSSCSHVG